MSFTTSGDVIAPILVSSSPADDAIAVANNSNIVLTFSEALDVESGNIVIYKTSDDSVVETIDVTSNQVTGSGTSQITINPSNDLSTSTEYYIKIDATAFDDPNGKPSVQHHIATRGDGIWKNRSVYGSDRALSSRAETSVGFIARNCSDIRISFAG